MLKNLRSSQNFTFLLVLILVANLIIFSVCLSIILQHNSRNQIASKATTLMETIDSIREYTIAHIQPELADELEANFLPETIPNFAARETFDILRQKPNYGDFFFKDATINPFNPRDRADDFETEIIEDFRKRERVRELSGFRPTPNGDLFYLARAIEVSQPSCLECHGEPSAASSSLVERYGSSDGFGWKLNEIVGIKIVFIPVDYFVKQTRRLFFTIAGVAFLIFLPLSIWLLLQNKPKNKKIR